MSNAYLKPKKKVKRLQKRIKDYEATMNKLNPQQQQAYTKPGSVNKG
jgi:uncharacterized protein YlxW (UPF0749 family)